jgi:hypothetical protein
MPFQPRTYYVAVCDEPDCGAIYQNFELEVDALFDNPNHHSVRTELSSWRWLAVAADRVLCPEHAPAWLDAQADALEIDATHDPLFTASGKPAHMPPTT